MKMASLAAVRLVAGFESGHLPLLEAWILLLSRKE